MEKIFKVKRVKVSSERFTEQINNIICLYKEKFNYKDCVVGISQRSFGGTDIIISLDFK